MNALTKWNPFGMREPVKLWSAERPWDSFLEMEREMATMLDRMDRMVGRWPMETKGEGLTVAAWTPSVDIIEDEKEYLVKAELPEVKKEEIKVRVRDHTLSITGERKAEKEEKGKKYHRIERTYGSFERSFMLPEEADAGKITSEFKDGVLKVHLPKVSVPEPKTTEVKVA
ncbi:MAG: Hsp20/alpha crystallin family protein [Verrucomicrobiales bacterium]|nr:Hsp20/alpha crystallin family protein [Verrucomicrobiales bacterium]